MLRVMKPESGILLGTMLDCRRDSLVQCLPYRDPSQGLWEAQGKGQRKGPSGRALEPNLLYKTEGKVDAGVSVYVCEQAYSTSIGGCIHTCTCAHTHTQRELGKHSEGKPLGWSGGNREPTGLGARFRAVRPTSLSIWDRNHSALGEARGREGTTQCFRLGWGWGRQAPTLTTATPNGIRCLAGFGRGSGHTGPLGRNGGAGGRAGMGNHGAEHYLGQAKSKPVGFAGVFGAQARYVEGAGTRENNSGMSV